MRILVWSKHGDALSLARIMKEKDNNEQVDLYIDNQDNKEVGDGIISKIELEPDWYKNEDFVSQYDLIVCDDEDQGEWVEYIENSYPDIAIFGTNIFGGLLENDRRYARKVMEQLGIKITPTWDFDNFEQVIDFIKQNPDRYVFKPYGQHPRYYTKVAKTEDSWDLIEFIKYISNFWQGGQNCQLQLFIDGIEIGCSAMFVRDHFVKPYEVNLEHKQMVQGLSGNVGEAGTLLFFRNESRIFDEILKPFESYLKATKFCGQFDINCIVNEDGIFPLEFTPRLGIPATYGYNEALKIRWTDFFYQSAKGILEDGFADTDRYIICVKLDIESIPDLKENNKYLIPSDIPIKFDFDPLGNEAGFFEGDLKKIDNQYYLTGTQRHVGVVVGSGKTIEEAREGAYSQISKIHAPVGILYNDKIGSEFYKYEKFLKQEGYI